MLFQGQEFAASSPFLYFADFDQELSAAVRHGRAEFLQQFPSLAAYEQYRGLFGEHPDFVAADRIRDESGCVLRYERTFMRPLLPGD